MGGREKKDGNLRDKSSWHMEEFTEQAVTIGVGAVLKKTIFFKGAD